MVVIYQLQRRQIPGVNLREVGLALRRQAVVIHLAKPDTSFSALDEDVCVTIAQDEQSAAMVLLPPDEGQRRLSLDEIISRIQRAGVQFGLDMQAVEQAHQQARYGVPVEIARGLEPVHGVDGRLDFHFRKKTTGAAKQLEDGKVDFRSLDLFENVTAGQTLVTRILPVPGTDGKNVRGRIIKAREGRNYPLPPGRNVEAGPDGNTLIATRSGRVDMVGNRVVVSDVLTISGDVNMGVGNLDFNGDITILGSIITGMQVKASGSIEVRGIVEGATLSAGADIKLHQGIQGGDRGSLSAGRNISARFIERCTVLAHGNIMSETIIHSQVQCGLELLVTKGRGSIIGGTACAGHQIATRIVGSSNGVATTLEVGVLPSQRKHVDDLKMQKRQQEQQLRKLEVVYGMFSGRSVESMAPKQRDQFQQVLASRLQFIQEIAEIDSQIQELTQAVENVNNGKVHILDRAFSGAKIVISGASMSVDSDIEFATFKKRDGEVTMSSCEYSV